MKTLSFISDEIAFKGMHNPILNDIHLNGIVYHNTKLANIIVLQSISLSNQSPLSRIKSCIAKESYPVYAHIGITWTVEAYVYAYTNPYRSVMKHHF